MNKKNSSNNETKTPSSNESKTFSNKKISTFAIVYLMIGLVFAIIYMLNYHWRLTALFSPGFFAVILTWPLQLVGLIKDIQFYGWGGKPF